ncbi:hypothetical protein ALNOE001_11750 [Candidatus Methanobinarius endosymbioticus]|uniref:Uncharacterized protein n=1 Tax=Candidatus Methanobinarius endosymbioticus TaxID=2006182 RepID=A0A366MC28_9EURY|nr:hypothetical protein ALNOE001_11750 [Candidatus Methanobinarius endosymbioticus]
MIQHYIDESIGVGWCLRTEDNYYLEIIAKIIEKIVKRINVKNEDILFFGSSAGGFTSVILGTMFKNSYVAVNNPQIDLKKYHHYEKVMKVCMVIKTQN